MRLEQFNTSYLTEGLEYQQIRSVRLWESTGKILKEAALTNDQIQQLFAEIEKGADSAGVNRTAIGKGKDTVVAVNKAWEDLKSKIQNSGPIKGFDQKVSDALSKIGAGAADPEFNGNVNKWVQKYRDFAKKHPIAQGAIYATLIALAGITGAGVGGAAALGLLKMADKLLQGERFSSAAYSGVKAGAMAFAASKLGDYLKGMKAGDQVPQPQAGDLPPGAPKMDFDKYDYYVGDSNNVVAVPKGSPNPFTGDDAAFDAMGQAKDLRAALRAPEGGDIAGSVADAGASSFASDPDLSPIQQKLAALVDAGKPLNDNQRDFLFKAMDKAALKAQMLGDMPDGTANAGMRQFMSLQSLARAAKFENRVINGYKLSEGQVYMIFNRLCQTNERMLSEGLLVEGPMDFIKGVAAKGKEKLAAVGKNITTRFTADKLNSIWVKAGSPTDSDDLYNVLDGAGVPPEVLEPVYKSLKIPVTTVGGRIEPTLDTPVDYKQIKQMVMKLPKDRKQRLINYITKQLAAA